MQQSVRVERHEGLEIEEVVGVRVAAKCDEGALGAC
jgi:hypothetical protein